MSKNHYNDAMFLEHSPKRTEEGRMADAELSILIEKDHYVFEML